MRKFLIFLGLIVLVIVAIPVVMLATGTIDRTSLKMVLNVMTGADGPPATEATVRGRYQVPEGFTISLYASGLPKARFMAISDAGDLLVSRPHSGDIILLRKDANGDGKPDGRETLIDSLQQPLGLDLHGQWLYIAESHRVSRVLFNSETATLDGPLHTVVDGLTSDGNHWSKTVRIGPDNKLYLAQGSTCNICEEDDTRRATMMRFELDGSAPEVIATGLRNSVGFDWAPFDGALYATDNGRDLLGDDFPPCELNRIEVGGFYGWPYFNGDNIPDPDMGDDPGAGARVPIAPVHPFRAHNAPLGISFLTGASLPAQYKHSALVALHGSWNRSSPDGYKVVSLHFNDDGIEERDFLTGFQREDDIIGRPVDVAQAQDGTIYISDDYAGAIYQVSYGVNTMENVTPLAMPARSRLDTEPPAWLAGADLGAMASSGAALYQLHACASCHEEGENPKRLDALSQRMGYNATIELLTAPPSPMPILPLSELEKRELAVYLLERPR